jgi:non-specific serine/threonine protein kinase
VLEGVTALADHSLVRRLSPVNGTPRYGMLETIREYGLERLADNGEEQDVRRAHASWAQELYDEVYRGIMERSDWTQQQRALANRDNLRTAATWLEATGDAEGPVRLVGSGGTFWFFCSARSEGRAWMERALDIALRSGVPAASCIRAAEAAGMFARNQGDYPRAIEWAQTLMALAHEANDPWGEYEGHDLLGYIALAQGAYEVATRHLTRSLELAEACGDRGHAAQERWDLGLAAFGLGDVQRATELMEDALSRMRALDGRWGMGLALNGLGLMACTLGEFDLAAARYRESLALWQQIGNKENLSECLSGMATLAAGTRSPEWAALMFGAAERMREEIGHAIPLPEGIAYQQAEAAVRVELGEELFLRAFTAGRAVSHDEVQQLAADFIAGTSQAPSLPAGLSPRPSARLGLTRREHEVLVLLCQRLTGAEIGEHLFIGRRTVETHVANIYNKLGVDNRRDALAAAVRLGLD